MTVFRRTLCQITLALLVGAGPVATFAASPAPGGAGGVDTRTTDTPAFTGGPVEVLLGVILLGIITALVTAAVARLVRPRSRS